ncbi:MAG TPA: preprotein translocase subunit Tim44 [Rhodobacteraceae bacterium]|jgi:predicted lipid-binding transport protein (Tim44 family)|nr:preprotein translocase subunit Tim44 [Paracoccaceae bacterium]HBV54281.1 preprotein translocase subunit Tim44 [Paracoccaceae bacterium]
MNQPLLQLLVLAAIAVFLILRLKSVLGTRDGFEKPVARNQPEKADKKRSFEVIDGGPDHDIIDHVEENTSAAKALAAMKRVEPSFGVADFLQGARGAYEMILMGFERGDLAAVKPFMSADVFEAFSEVVEDRASKGLKVEADFIGIRELTLADATFDQGSNEAEVTVRFVAEITSVVRDQSGDVVEGKPGEIKRIKDVWTFARSMGENDPNWELVATGE